jgi:chaperonin GroES
VIATYGSACGYAVAVALLFQHEVMNMKPLADRILIAPVKLPEKTEGGILLPESARNDSAHLEGEVLAVGPKVKDVKPGDHVLYSAEAGIEVGENRLVTFEDCIAIV